MDQRELFNLYEKLYFHELESREKILNRLQIPLAIIVSFVSFYGYIAKGIDFSTEPWNILIYVLIFVSISLFAITIYNFIRAFFNHTYELIPTAIETEGYRLELIDLYKGYPTSAQLVEDAFDAYLYRYYSECSTVNTKINDERASFVYNCNKYLVSNLPFLFLIFLVFSFCGIDKNSREKEYKVEIVKPVELNGIKNPIKTHSEFENGEITVNLSESAKEFFNDRREKEENHQSATTSTASTEEAAP